MFVVQLYVLYVTATLVIVEFKFDERSIPRRQKLEFHCGQLCHPDKYDSTRASVIFNSC